MLKKSDTLIKHQSVRGETLIPYNMPRSVLEFTGIAWVSLRLRLIPLKADMLRFVIDVC
jgi:hypothetical protein